MVFCIVRLVLGTGFTSKVNVVMMTLSASLHRTAPIALVLGSFSIFLSSRPTILKCICHCRGSNGWIFRNRGLPYLRNIARDEETVTISTMAKTKASISCAWQWLVGMMFNKGKELTFLFRDHVEPINDIVPQM